jgi:hypothetical protein
VAAGKPSVERPSCAQAMLCRLTAEAVESLLVYKGGLSCFVAE